MAVHLSSSRCSWYSFPLSLDISLSGNEHGSVDRKRRDRYSLIDLSCAAVAGFVWVNNSVVCSCLLGSMISCLATTVPCVLLVLDLPWPSFDWISFSVCDFACSYCKVCCSVCRRFLSSRFLACIKRTPDEFDIVLSLFDGLDGCFLLRVDGVVVGEATVVFDSSVVDSFSLFAGFAWAV